MKILCFHCQHCNKTPEKYECTAKGFPMNEETVWQYRECSEWLWKEPK